MGKEEVTITVNLKIHTQITRIDTKSLKFRGKYVNNIHKDIRKKCIVIMMNYNLEQR